jgi:hypothetical protein
MMVAACRSATENPQPATNATEDFLLCSFHTFSESRGAEIDLMQLACMCFVYQPPQLELPSATSITPY